MKLTRRALLMAACAAPAFAGEEDLELRDLRVPGPSNRFTLLLPRHTRDRVPLIILLHGLGETVDERMGAYAWIERYGLLTAYERLRRPPVARTTTRADWTDARVAELNAKMTRRPFRGAAIACPFTPDLVIGAPGVLDGFARWLVEVVAARARAESTMILDGPEHTLIGGCSLGGHFSLECFIRRTTDFGAWAGVQTAISEASAPGWADRLARALGASKRPILLETSTADPFRRASEALHAELARRGVASDLLVLPGPHDQPWLRESGTLEMLYWLDSRPRRIPRLPAPAHPGAKL
jgi:predicted esterase